MHWIPLSSDWEVFFSCHWVFPLYQQPSDCGHAYAEYQMDSQALLGLSWLQLLISGEQFAAIAQRVIGNELFFQMRRTTEALVVPAIKNPMAHFVNGLAFVSMSWPYSS